MICIWFLEGPLFLPRFLLASAVAACSLCRRFTPGGPAPESQCLKSSWATAVWGHCSWGLHLLPHFPCSISLLFWCWSLGILQTKGEDVPSKDCCPFLTVSRTGDQPGTVFSPWEGKDSGSGSPFFVCHTSPWDRVKDSSFLYLVLGTEFRGVLPQATCPGPFTFETGLPILAWNLWPSCWSLQSHCAQLLFFFLVLGGVGTGDEPRASYRQVLYPKLSPQLQNAIF